MIRQGRNEDLPIIMKMVAETIHIMREEKNDQWDEKYPTEDIFQQDIQKGNLYIWEEKGEVLGSISVDTNLPDEYKGILWRKESAAYTFHRLVIGAVARKKGMASHLIAHAEYVALQNQVPYMKIDTYSLNKKAQALFEKLGYIKSGEMTYHGKENPFYCYDKCLT